MDVLQLHGELVAVGNILVVVAKFYLNRGGGFHSLQVATHCRPSFISVMYFVVRRFKSFSVADPCRSKSFRQCLVVEHGI